MDYYDASDAAYAAASAARRATPVPHTRPLHGAQRYPSQPEVTRNTIPTTRHPALGTHDPQARLRALMGAVIRSQR